MKYEGSVTMGYKAVGSAQDVIASLRRKGYLEQADKQKAHISSQTLLNKCSLLSVALKNLNSVNILNWARYLQDYLWKLLKAKARAAKGFIALLQNPYHPLTDFLH